MKKNPPPHKSGNHLPFIILTICISLASQKAASTEKKPLELIFQTDFPVASNTTAYPGQKITVLGSLISFQDDFNKSEIFVKAVLCKVGNSSLNGYCRDALDTSCKSLIQAESAASKYPTEEITKNRGEKDSLIFMLKEIKKLSKSFHYQPTVTIHQLTVPQNAEAGNYDILYTAGISKSGSCDGVNEWLNSRYDRIKITTNND